jgi:hypothetical protein
MARDESVTEAALAAMDGPVVWGKSDCCASACDVFMELRGVDPLAPVRGRYSSVIEAARLIRAGGGFLMLARRLARHAGLSRVLPRPGSLGLTEPGMALGPEGRALAICVGRGTWIAKGIDGAVMLSDAAICEAWDVE